MATQDKDLTSEEVLRLLTLAVWNASDDNDGDCPPSKLPTFRQLDGLISTTAWGTEARYAPVRVHVDEVFVAV